MFFVSLNAEMDIGPQAESSGTVFDRGYSSAGRATALHAVGRRFESV